MIHLIIADNALGYLDDQLREVYDRYLVFLKE